MRLLASCGLLIALGFIAASAWANHQFAGAIGVLPVAANALCPFWLHYSRGLIARSTLVVLWVACLVYSFTAAIAFAAGSKDAAAATPAALHANLQTELQTLADMERLKQPLKTIIGQREKIMSMRTAGAIKDPEPHITLIASTTGYAAASIKLFYNILLALVIELGATVILFASLAALLPVRPGPAAISLDTDH